MTKLDINSVTKSYKKTIALDDFSKTLTNGIYGLLGPNGAGKTTLINIIVGLLKADCGTVKLNNQDSIALKSHYYNYIGYMPQYPKFYFNFTALELMQYMASLKNVKSEHKIQELLEFVNLGQQQHKKVGSFSGGMRQRLAIAAAIINDPKILILDEPTAGLDPNERIRFRNLISRLREDRIIIIATHIVSDVEFLADEIILIGNGKLVDSGKPIDLCEKMQGKVWTVTVDDEVQLAEYIKNTTVSSITHDDKYVLKIISDNSPCESALLAQASLEDVFLNTFQGVGTI